MLKSILITSLLTFWMLTSVFGQITEREKPMTTGIHNALTLEIPDTKRKFAENLWKKYTKTFGGKTKRNRKSKEYFSENASIPGISTVNIYSSLEEDGNSTALSVWIDMGDEFLSSYTHSDEYTDAEKMLMEFGLEVLREKVRMELEDEEDQMKRLAKRLKKLERANSNYHRDIKVAEEKIQKAEDNISKNEIEQAETKSSIEMQEAALEAVRKRLSDI